MSQFGFFRRGQDQVYLWSGLQGGQDQVYLWLGLDSPNPGPGVRPGDQSGLATSDTKVFEIETKGADRCKTYLSGRIIPISPEKFRLGKGRPSDFTARPNPFRGCGRGFWQKYGILRLCERQNQDLNTRNRSNLMNTKVNIVLLMSIFPKASHLQQTTSMKSWMSWTYKQTLNKQRSTTNAPRISGPIKE